jgi:hypothetical protein
VSWIDDDDEEEEEDDHEDDGLDEWSRESLVNSYQR